MANLSIHQRAPKRISITLALQPYERLQTRSDWEGRSLSNLAAYLLEQALTEWSLNDAAQQQR
jgi:hypothetical protein